MIQDSQSQKIIVAAGNLIFNPAIRTILLVQEKDAEFYGKWNFPMGKLEPGESIIQCAKREGKEETGLEVKPSYLIGKYRGKYQNQLGQNCIIIGFIFKSEIIGGKLEIPEDILATGWFSFEEIKELNDKGSLIDSYILSVIEDFVKGRNFPLDSPLIVI